MGKRLKLWPPSGRGILARFSDLEAAQEACAFRWSKSQRLLFALQSELGATHTVRPRWTKAATGDGGRFSPHSL